LEGDRFEAAQYTALARLIDEIAQLYPLDAVAGHEHVASGRKRDPGEGFDWARLTALMAAKAPYFPEGLPTRG
jgi:AmpD protein